MKIAHLIVVGKLKDKSLEAIEDDYLKRISNPVLKIHEVKAKAENKDQEADIILKKIQDITKGDKTYLVALTEFGSEYHSPEFSKWVFDKIENQPNLVFLIAGAEGHGKAVLDQVNASVSLSKLTFPHKIARVLFVEQFYRALTIKNGHPYHN